MDKLQKLMADYLANSNSDAIAVAVIDFNNSSFKSFEVHQDDLQFNTGEGIIYFDLASLTKPLTNSFVHISENIQERDMELLLNHRAGLPAWGILEKKNWKEQIFSYAIKESDTLYSDFSALRYMLEFEKQTSKDFQKVSSLHHDKNIKFWKDLTSEKVLQNGFYHAKPNIGKVHDPNAHNIDAFTSHAGLFGTGSALARTLIEFNKKFSLLDKFNSRSKTRFHLGFDTVENPEMTLAGAGCSELTFGHLGFTGTSFWIDPKKEKGHIILTNATKLYWHDKIQLNKFRKTAGEMIWRGDV